MKTHNRLAAGVQQQLLGNYYQQKYQTIMQSIEKIHPIAKAFPSRRDRDLQDLQITPFTQHSRIDATPTPIKQSSRLSKKINFKEVILRSKYDSNTSSVIGESRPKINFKNELILKSKQDARVEGRKHVFSRLEKSLIQQLSSPSPSKFEIKGTGQVTLRANSRSPSKQSAPEPIKEDCIEVEEDYEELWNAPNDYNSNKSHQQRQEISYKIRKSFAQRNSRSTSPYKSKKSRQSSQNSGKGAVQSPKSNKNLKYISLISPSQKSASKRSSLDKSNSNGKAIKYIPKSHLSNNISNKPQQETKAQQPCLTMNESIQENIHNETYSMEYSVSQQQIIPPLVRNLVESTFTNEHKLSQIEPFGQQLNQLHQDSLQSQEVSIEKTDKQLFSQKRRLAAYQAKESINEMSFLSRFSLNSQEVNGVQQNLQKQLNESGFGPYQSGLSNIYDMISFYPHIKEIYVVGQRILDDRKKYIMKKRQQQYKINQCKTKINKLKKKQDKCKMNKEKGEDGVIEQNRLTILRLVRYLGTEIV